MAGSSSGTKKMEAQASLKRAKDGSAFVRCVECNKDVAAALISMHNCNSEAKLKSKLEALVVENQVEIKKKKEGNSEAALKKKEKKPKDQRKPKRPPTAFFLFMDDFRKTFKEEHSDRKSAAMVAKEAGEKWKLMTYEEKKPYIDKAAEFKEEYLKNLQEQRGEEKDDQEDSSQPRLYWEKSLVVVVVVVVLVAGRRFSWWRS